MSRQVFYVYFDDTRNRYYYYDTTTASTTFVRPATGRLIDPETKRPFVFPGDEPAPIVLTKRSATVSSRGRPAGIASFVSGRFVRVPPEVQAEVARVRGDPPAAPAAAKRAPVPIGDRVALDARMHNEIHRFQVQDYAAQFFREHRTGGLFSRKAVSVEAVSQWQNTPIREPLHRLLPPALERPACECFRAILAYTEQQEQAALARLAALAFDSPPLRDEVYFQLIKQTRENPSADGLQRTWELFLMFATFFPSTRNSEIWIKAHIVAALERAAPALVDLVQFCYLRFSARCVEGRVTELTFPFPGLLTSPRDYLSETPAYPASLYEQMWQQRNTHPALEVPFFEDFIARALLQKGAARTEGVFRVAGNLRKVQELPQALSARQLDAIDDCTVHDLASLFKAWFAAIPGMLVPQDLVLALVIAPMENGFVRFAERLEDITKAVLKYLIGFLRALAAQEGVTKMGAQNLAIVFAPTIVDLSMSEPTAMGKRAEIARDFLVELIRSWDIDKH
jgi:hypothetical protein